MIVKKKVGNCCHPIGTGSIWQIAVATATKITIKSQARGLSHLQPVQPRRGRSTALIHCGRAGVEEPNESAHKHHQLRPQIG